MYLLVNIELYLWNELINFLEIQNINLVVFSETDRRHCVGGPQILSQSLSRARSAESR